MASEPGGKAGAGRARGTVDRGRSAHDDPAMPVSVLIVDDSDAFREVAREVLAHRGYAVVGEAATAAEALELARRLRPRAVLLDVRLPDGNGFDIAEALTSDEPAPAIVLMSADRSHPDAAVVHGCGARGFVLKSELADTALGDFWPPA